MGIFYVLGRLLFGAYFLYHGYNHFAKADKLIGYAKSKGVAQAKEMVYLGGILLLLGGFSFVTNAFMGFGVLALLLFMIPVTFKMHQFWTVTDPEARASEMSSFMRNMALIGALLMLLPAGSMMWNYPMFW